MKENNIGNAHEKRGPKRGGYLGCFIGSGYDYREAWLTGMGACHLCLRSFNVCVRKIETDRQSRKSLSSSCDSNDCVLCPLKPLGHSIEPSPTP